MKVLAATLLALLLVASCSPAEAHLDSVPTSCCFTYQTRPIPRNLITSIYFTSSSCSQPGVIVVTKKGKQLCADPRQPWVQERLKHFQSPPN
ncbi:CCL4 protein, partial [Sakesphorus luctuosus]|nr:CCL4 protein [Sakesphorus luctuosus]